MSERLQAILAPISTGTLRKALGAPQHIVITMDPLGVAISLQKILAAQQHRVELVNTCPPACDIAIFLDGLAQFDSVDAAIACQRRVFSHVKTIAAHFSQQGGTLFIVQNTQGTFGFTPMSHHQAWAAGLAGLAKTAQQEWPKAQCKAIDIDVASFQIEDIANLLSEELCNQREVVECGFVAKNKCTTVVPAQIAHNTGEATPITARDVFIVTGGARGITSSCLIGLAKKYQACFVLLGRTTIVDEPMQYKPLLSKEALQQFIFSESVAKGEVLTPRALHARVATLLANREIMYTVSTLNRMGSDAIYVTADVLNEQDVQEKIHDIRQTFGNITGVIHAAGVLADKWITEKSMAEFDLVFNTKVVGLKNILNAVKQDPLKFLILFSSVAGRFGNRGQCDYAMANETLNKVAQLEKQKRGDGVLVKALNWGPWDSGMVTKELNELFASRGIAIMPSEQGIQHFIHELEQPSESPVEVLLQAVIPARASPHRAVLPDAGRLRGDGTDMLMTVSCETHPYILSHVVNNVPILPACLVMEWFVDEAQRQGLVSSNTTLTDFKVLKGISLPDFSTRQSVFSVRGMPKRSKTEAVFLELRNEEQRVCYSAIATQRHTPSQMLCPCSLSQTQNQAWPWPIEEIYANPYSYGNEKKLFSGPAFQAISKLLCLNALGGQALLANAEQLKWPGPLKTDMPVVDGVLQLIFLWGLYTIGKRTLPASIGEISFFNRTHALKPLHCSFQNIAVSPQKIVANAQCRDDDGNPYLILSGMEFYEIGTA